MSDDFTYKYPSGAEVTIRATELGSKATADQRYIIHTALDSGDGELISETNPLPTQIVDPTNGLAASIKQDPETLSNELLVLMENHICDDKTTSTPLLAGATFTGDWQNHLSPEQVSRIIDCHSQVMKKFDYLDDTLQPSDLIKLP